MARGALRVLLVLLMMAPAVASADAIDANLEHDVLVNADATHYYSFWLLPDERIADLWSSTE